jgi:hypothetical protein
MTIEAPPLPDRRFTERGALATRMEVVESLAANDPSVVAPRRLDRALVEPMGGWLVTITEFQQGDIVELSQPGAGELLGRTLAQLHHALAQLLPQHLPAVAAPSDTTSDTDRSDWQLLHGDFSDQNLIATARGLRILDFDAEVEGRALRHDTFRPAFLAGCSARSGTQLDQGTIDDLIATRVTALGRWLDDLSTAPIGLRTSSAAWQDVLRSFVRSQQRRDD